MNTSLLLAVIGVVALVIMVECVMILKRNNDKKISCEKRQNVCLRKKEKASLRESEKASKCGKVIYLKDRKREYNKQAAKKGYKAPVKAMHTSEVRRSNHSNNQWWI